MDEDAPRGRKGKLSSEFIVLVLVFVLGIVAGIYLSQAVEPYLFPQKALQGQQIQQIQTQNQLLKEQIDCFANGIRKNHGQATLTECT